MDWSKTKSIFIFVFLILNIFLYSQYVNTYSEGQRIEILGEKNIEAKLKEDNITYDLLPSGVESASYLTAKVKQYTLDDMPSSTNFSYKLVTENALLATAKSPIKLKNPLDEMELMEFVQQYVYEGAAFTLWEYDEETRTALFFQRLDNKMFYFSKGYLKLHWNSNNEIYMYEQAMLEKMEELEQQLSIDQPLEVLQALYAKNMLKQNDQIKDMKLGYSTLAQLTQTQVFAPTWEVHVETAQQQTERYFVNAVEGKVIELDQESQLQALEE